ncbi:hypothetical protein F4808DRAFT_376561 [Astrocystis sublimbata]|nr:hypothetical protein F4808DRAFT_376561 [Astrocystis sublimbata]
MMVSQAATKTLNWAAAEPGSIARRWDRDELIRCRATGTGITLKPDLEGQAHPMFANWTANEPNLYQELKQPILLASKILETAGLTWLSDFLVRDIFGEDYPGREATGISGTAVAYEDSKIPCSIVRYHTASWATPRIQSKWRQHTRDKLSIQFPKLIKWQIDGIMFQQKGWNGYTCRHPRGDLPLDDIDQYENIKTFDEQSPDQDLRSLTILIMAEFPARLAELRRKGEAQGEEYLLTAFMATVTILHELGHAVYWQHKRSLTQDMREPFYGADLEMELGDSFVAAIFGGWVPIPVREPSRLRQDFSFADGVAWRQALSWDHHRMRPKYRAHYSISVDYITRLFTDANWSTTATAARELIRPQFLTGNSIALRTISLYAPLSQANQHATAAIADFHGKGDRRVWNRRPGARFRIPYYDGFLCPEPKLPMESSETSVLKPAAKAKEHRQMTPAKNSSPPNRSSIGAGCTKEEEKAETVRMPSNDGFDKTKTQKAAKQGITGRNAAMEPSAMLKSDYSTRKLALPSPATTRSLRPRSSGWPAPRIGMEASEPRRWTKEMKALPPARGRAAGGKLQIEQIARRSRSPAQTRDHHQHCGAEHRDKSRSALRMRQHEKEHRSASSGGDDEAILGGCKADGNSHGYNPAGSHDPSDSISVDELKKRLSKLVGVSLTELERLFDGSTCKPVGVE